jgi:aerobic-type carbon monoxide dehydrogenase small subunit (CoxS/CutS family)
MDGDVLVIGAMVRQSAAERSAEVRVAAPLLAEALGHVAHPPIRNSGTVVGSIAHADPAAELPTVALAMDAEMTAVGPQGERRIPAADFFQGPFTTALESDEILTEVRLPQFAGGHAFVEFARTHGNFAVVGVAALLAVTDGRITRAAIAASGVAPTPLRLSAAEQALDGVVPDGAAFRAAVDAGTAGLQPSGTCRAARPPGSTSPGPSCATPSSAPPSAPRTGGDPEMTDLHPITLTVNGREYTVAVEPRRLLVDVLRDDFGLTGTHIGCEHGVCGTCTVLLDGASIRSCITLAVQADGAEIRTVEGLADGAALHPLQEEFWDKQGLQCGYCTPGMLLRACELLEQTPDPTAEQVREGIASNLCRCTGYQYIVEAVLAAAPRMRERAAAETPTETTGAQA